MVSSSVYGGRSRRSQALMAEGLPHALLEFVGLCIPSFQAAELLVLLAGNVDRSFTEEEIVTAVRPALISASAVREHTASFVKAGLIIETNGQFQYRPTSADLELRVGELVRAYHEKPVTLVTAIYRVADRRIRGTGVPFDPTDD